jgi:hypothetical protein
MTPKPYRLPKVRIVGLVNPRTLASLQAWRKAYGIPIGESIDALFDHAMRGEGAFVFRLPVTGKPNSEKLHENGNPLPDNSDKQHETTTL